MRRYRLFLPLLLLVACGLLAQTPAPATPDAIDILLSAKTVAAVGDVGWREDVWLWGGPSREKSQKRLEQELQKWGRFQVVSDVVEADLVVLLVEGSRQRSVLGGTGEGNPHGHTPS